MTPEAKQLLESMLILAKYWKQPLTVIEAMTYDEFVVAMDLANKQVQDQNRDMRAPSGGRYRRIT